MVVEFLLQLRVQLPVFELLPLGADDGDGPDCDGQGEDRQDPWLDTRHDRRRQRDGDDGGNHGEHGGQDLDAAVVAGGIPGFPIQGLDPGRFQDVQVHTAGFLEQRQVQLLGQRHLFPVGKVLTADDEQPHTGQPAHQSGDMQKRGAEAQPGLQRLHDPLRQPHGNRRQDADAEHFQQGQPEQQRFMLPGEAQHIALRGVQLIQVGFHRTKTSDHLVRSTRVYHSGLPASTFLTIGHGIERKTIDMFLSCYKKAYLYCAETSRSFWAIFSAICFL